MSARGAADDRERGSATVWVMAAAALILSLAVFVVVVAAAATARHRAQATADLAALAAAARIGIGGEPCGAADEVTRANGADMISCAAQVSVDGRTGSVRVAVRWSFIVLLVGHREAQARSEAARVGSVRATRCLATASGTPGNSALVLAAPHLASQSVAR